MNGVLLQQGHSFNCLKATKTEAIHGHNHFFFPIRLELLLNVKSRSTWTAADRLRHVRLRMSTRFTLPRPSRRKEVRLAILTCSTLIGAITHQLIVLACVYCLTPVLFASVGSVNGYGLSQYIFREIITMRPLRLCFLLLFSAR